jgi:membrane protein DedA with SNARE-associated domain
MDFVLHWVAQYGYAALFLLVALGIVGLPIPDEAILMFAGFLVSDGDLKLGPAFLASFCGTVFGITMSYVLGRFVGVGLFNRFAMVFRPNPEAIRKNLRRVERWFLREGVWVLAFGYFIPGIRHLSAIVAGMSRLRPGLFALVAYSAAFCWTAFFIGFGYLVGKKWAKYAVIIHRNMLIGFGCVVVLLCLILILRRAWRRPVKDL